VKTDASVSRWPVYRCLYAEVHHRKHIYLLNTGKWYEVAPDFLLRVDQSIDAVSDEGISLPDYHDASEGAYNERVAREQPDRFVLMDRKLIRYPGRANTIEFCDLLATSKALIHVKRYAGSSTLSHLFAQGLVSGELFAGEEGFRKQVAAELPETQRILVADGKPNSYTVAYAVISQSKKRLTLPFFSRINLRNAYRRLTGLGYRVALVKIATVNRNP
jgi:uncharacterized protein (TIGR04141 family)